MHENNMMGYIVLGSSGRNKGARQYMDLGLYEKYGKLPELRKI